MTDQLTKVKKTRTPRNEESIKDGVMKLSLQAKVSLRDALNEAIEAEVKSLQEAAKQAEQIANGTK
jgi:hypothetical protein